MIFGDGQQGGFLGKALLPFETFEKYLKIQQDVLNN